MNRRIDLVGTAGRSAISTKGGFNFSEYNIQIHDSRQNSDATGYSGQDHSHKMYNGRNPLNAPQSTNDTGKNFGVNKDVDWREDKLAPSLPVFAQSNTVELTTSAQRHFQGTDSSHLQKAFRYGYAQNDPALQHLLNERAIAPEIHPVEWSQSDKYLHSDVGVPSVVNQNLIETGTFNKFPEHVKQVSRGHHTHHLKSHLKTNHLRNNSNVSTGTHHRSGNPTHPVLHGTRGPLERPTLYVDFPRPDQPHIRPQEGPGSLSEIGNRAVFLFA